MEYSPSDPLTLSPSQRTSSKRQSFNNRQSGSYVSQVRSLPTSNPIKEPLIEHPKQNRVSSTENPRKYIIKSPSLQKEDSNNFNNYGNTQGFFEKMTEDFNKRYARLEEKLKEDVESLEKKLKTRDSEVEALREQVFFKDRTLEDFEKRVERLNTEIMRKNEEFLRKMLEGKDLSVQELLVNKISILEQKVQEKDSQIQLLQQKGSKDHEFLREKDQQLREITEKILQFTVDRDNAMKNEAQCAKLVREIEEKDGEIQTLLREIEGYKEKLLEISRENAEKDELIKKLQENSKEIGAKVLEFHAEDARIQAFLLEIDDYKGRIRELSRENEEFLRTIALKDEIIRKFQENEGKSPQSKHFSEFLQENLPKNASFSEEIELKLANPAQTEKTKRAFVGEAQHLQEKVRVLSQKLEEITTKYEALLRETQGKSLSFVNEKVEKLGSLTTIYNDRFFGEQIQSIMTRNQVLFQENETIKRQKLEKDENLQKMNRISREKIQENERLKKKLFLLQRDFEEVQNKWGAEFKAQDLVNENQELRAKLQEIEENYHEKNEEEISRIYEEFALQQQKLLEKLQETHDNEKAEFRWNYERKSQETAGLYEKLAKIGQFLEGIQGESPEIRRILAEIREKPVLSTENFSEISVRNLQSSADFKEIAQNELFPELVQEKYHRKILENLLNLLRKRLLELGNLPEIQELLSEMENFSIAEENPYAQLEENARKIQELDERNRELCEKLSFSQSPREWPRVFQENIAIKRELFRKTLDFQRVSQQLDALAQEFSKQTEHYDALEVEILEAFGARAEQILRKSRVSQLKLALSREFWGKHASFAEKDESLRVKALNSTVEELNKQLFSHKRRWKILVDELQSGQEKSKAFDTFRALEQENPDFSKTFSENADFFTDFNETQLKLAESQRNQRFLRAKLENFAEKFREFAENSGNSSSFHPFVSFLTEMLEKSQGIYEEKSVREQELEELRLKYVQNAIELENFKSSVSQEQSFAGKSRNFQEKLKETQSFQGDFSFGEENREIQRKMQQILEENQRFVEENRQIREEIAGLQAKAGKNEALSHENQRLLQENLKYVAEIERILEENEAVRSKLKESVDEIASLSTKNQEMSVLNESLRKEIALCKEKVEKSQANALDLKIFEETQALRKKTELLMQENKELFVEKQAIFLETQRISQENAVLQGKVKELVAENREIKRDFSFFEENRELRGKIEELLRENKQVSQEKLQISLEKQQIYHENQVKSLENQRVLKEKQEIQEKLAEIAQKYAENCEENEKIKRLLEETQVKALENQALREEILIYKRQFSEGQEIFKENQQFRLENSRLSARIAELSQENARILEENADLRTKLAISSRNEENSQEIKQKLNELLETQQPQGRNFEAEPDFREKFEEKQQVLSQMLDFLQEIGAETDGFPEEFSTPGAISSGFSRISRVFQRISQENREISEKYRDLQGKYEHNAQELGNLLKSQENTPNDGKLRDFSKKIEVLLKENEKLRQQFASFSEKTRAIASENRELREKLEFSKQTRRTREDEYQETVVQRLKSRVFALEDALERKLREKVEALRGKTLEKLEKFGEMQENRRVSLENAQFSQESARICREIEELKEVNGILARDKALLKAQVEQLKVICRNLKEEMQNCYGFMAKSQRNT